MTGALLRSGKISSFKALGKAGQPVHRAALQLRNTIRRKDEISSLCLAIPQPDQQGDNIDWYSPVAGDVISWGAATDLEREAALFRLERVKSDLTKMRESLLPSEAEQADQGESLNKDKHVFAELLEYVIRFPDQDFVYLVRSETHRYQFSHNGQADQWSNVIPVLTFWGFVHADDMLGSDPLYCLYPQKSVPSLVAPVAAAAIAPAAVAAVASPEVVLPVKTRVAWWRRWLWWLLPLLLLLLLLFFFRGCAPSLPSFGMGAPSLPTLPTSKPRLPELPNVELPRIPSVPVGTVNVPSLPGVGAVNVPSLPNGGAVNVPSMPGGGLPSMAEGAGNGAAGELPLPGENLDVAAPQGEPPALDTANAPELPSNPSSEPQDPAELTPPTLPQDPSELDSLGLDTQPSAQPNTELSTQPNTQQNTQPAEGLNIPAQAKADGSTDFLNGHWKAKGGIQDQRTGKPLQLEYQFDDGKGEVTIRRNDGVSCTGPVSAAMSNGSLGINSQGQAKCSDGSSYEMPAVNCQQGAKSMADCAGSYGNTTFPMTMRNAGA